MWAEKAVIGRIHRRVSWDFPCDFLVRTTQEGFRNQKLEIINQYYPIFSSDEVGNLMKTKNENMENEIVKYWKSVFCFPLAFPVVFLGWFTLFLTQTNSFQVSEQHQNTE